MEDKLIAYQTRAQASVTLLARLLMASFFLWSAYSRVSQWSVVMDYLRTFSIPYVEVIMGVATAIEFLGGMMILLGFYARQASVALIIWLVASTLLFNRFWTFGESERFLQEVMFMKNLAIIGSLEILRVFGAGRYSIRD